MEGLYPAREPVPWSDVPGVFVSSLPALLLLLLFLGGMLFAFEAYPSILQRRESARRGRRR